MPTYQYACTECEHTFEQFQSFSDDALTVCPECSGKLRKLFNAVGVVFKGSGFYRNDSRATSTSSDTPKSEPATDGSPKTEPAKKKDTSANGSSPASTPAPAGG
jgi:putative FmdB family regulatory protein